MLLYIVIFFKSSFFLLWRHTNKKSDVTYVAANRSRKNRRKRRMRTAWKTKQTRLHFSYYDVTLTRWWRRICCCPPSCWRPCRPCPSWRRWRKWWGPARRSPQPGRWGPSRFPTFPLFPPPVWKIQVLQVRKNIRVLQVLKKLVEK